MQVANEISIYSCYFLNTIMVLNPFVPSPLHHCHMQTYDNFQLGRLYGIDVWKIHVHARGVFVYVLEYVFVCTRYLHLCEGFQTSIRPRVF